MDFPRVIRSETQHQEYLNRLQELLEIAPPPGSVENEEIELLILLIESFENQKFPIQALDPIDAITFRMQERGLRQADLVPYFGTRSRVSEVLARKRPLTIPMIRALSVGLGIPAETLVGTLEKDLSPAQENEVGPPWSRFPTAEMIARGWIHKATGKASASIEEIVQKFIGDAGLAFGTAAFRRSIHGETYSPTTRYALHAWLARVVHRAREKKQRLGPFDPSSFSTDFLRDLARLSWSDHGPKVAIEFLEKHGIAVVIEPALKSTLLDGAALKDKDGTPIVGMTLRHDRLDNYWFTLLHEVVHLWKHVGEERAYVDDLDAASEDETEAEANRIAQDALIPRVAWKRSQAHLAPSNESIVRLADELRIHPAIVAGRVRRETKDYKQFSDLVGHRQVRKLFLPETDGLSR